MRPTYETSRIKDGRQMCISPGPSHISLPCRIFGLPSVFLFRAFLGPSSFPQHPAQSPYMVGTRSVEWMTFLDNHSVGQNPWGLISHWTVSPKQLSGRCRAELGKAEAKFHPHIFMQIVKMLGNRDFMTSLSSLGTESARIMGSPDSVYLPFTIV